MQRTFSAIPDAERADVAMRVIDDGNRPLKEIAGLPGFSAQSALARWFRGRFVQHRGMAHRRSSAGSSGRPLVERQRRDPSP
jgi:transcriptional regulator GlxA family with amidase domain